VSRLGLAACIVLGLAGVLLVANARARTRIHEMETFCGGVLQGQPIESVRERGANLGLSAWTHTDVEGVLFRTDGGINLLQPMVFCDVRTEHGRVVSKDFFLD
jgi:hypothetical protein